MSLRPRRHVKAQETFPIEIVDTPTGSECEICQAEFIDPEDLEHHSLQVHLSKSSKQRYCRLCRLLLPSVEELALHTVENHIISLRACGLCCRVFRNDAEVRVHEIKHQEVTKSMFTCSQCPLLFRSLDNLITHEFDEHEECLEGILLKSSMPFLSSLLNIKAQTFLLSLGKVTSLTCTNCQYKTAKLKQYVEHLSKNGCRSLACDICCNVFSKKATLIQHVKRHTNGKDITENNIKCKLCNRYYVKSKLAQHLQNCKSVIRCRTCNQIFTTVTELTNHQTSEHPNLITLIACQYCHKNIINTSIENHIEKLHSHELHLYKYSCKMCDVPFKHPQKLFAHYYVNHPDLQPFSCQICNQKFRSRKNFTLHIKLRHNSNGTVEFDDNFHVCFIDKLRGPNILLTDHDYTKKAPAETDVSVYNLSKVSVSTLNEKTGQLIVTKSVLPPIEKARYRDVVGPTNELKKRTESEHSIEYIEEYLELDSDEESQDDKKIRPLTEIKNTELRVVIKNSEQNTVESDDDEPLANIRKKKVKTLKKGDLKKFICKICYKNCYTFQNYTRHKSVHAKDKPVQCIKCNKLFKSTRKLDRHLRSAHTHSKLIDTLQKVLQRKKRGLESELAWTENELSVSDKFRSTIKKVKIEPGTVKARLKQVSENNGISVKNFLETFTPDAFNDNKRFNKRAVLKFVRTPILYRPKIMLTQVTDVEETFHSLSMPVKFTDNDYYKSKAKIQIVSDNTREHVKLNFGEKMNFDSIEYQEDQKEDFEYFEDDNSMGEDNYETTLERPQPIPEVGHEVSLGEENEQKKTITQNKILIPHIENARIAHLTNQAPFYKIVKVNEIFKSPQEQDEPAETTLEVVEGKKFVNVNPLQHLLGGRELPKSSTSKYYKPKRKDFKVVLAKALQALDKPVPEKRINRTKKPIE